MVCFVERAGLALEVLVVEMAGLLRVLLVLYNLLVDKVPTIGQNGEVNLLLLLIGSSRLLVNSPIVLLQKVAHSAASCLVTANFL